MTLLLTHPVMPALGPRRFFRARATAKHPRRTGRIRRILVGGNLADLGRIPRYIAFALLGGAMIWTPITGYLKTAPLAYKSQTSLILPGSGASASLNLNGIGQASSYANSAFASNAVSPTETYKRLLGADRILAAAAQSLGIAQSDLGRPRVDLVNQTSLIHFELTGGSPIDAQARGEAILAAFFAELDALRADEQQTRQDSSLDAIADYRASVATTRADIAALQSQTGLLSKDQFEDQLARQTALETQVQALAAASAEKAAAVAALQARLGLDPAAAAATLKLFADGEYLALHAAVATEAARLAEATAQYGPRHPRVAEADAAHGTARAAATLRAAGVTGLSQARLEQLDLAPDGPRAALLAELVRNEAERDGVAGQLAALTALQQTESARLRDIAPAAARLQDLQRDFSVAEAIFASAIARSQSTKADVYASYPLVQVLENPSLPEHPSSPNRKLALAAGVAATLMMLVGLMLGWVRLALISRLLAKPAAA